MYVGPGLPLVVIATLALAAVISAAERGACPGLPFTVTVTPEKLDPLPDYMGPKNPNDMDFPYCPITIDGEYWIIYKNGYSGPVLRFKGTNIENAVRQPDGTAKFPLRAPYILGGMWYDEAEKRLYAPMHCEQGGYARMVLREIHLATSVDKGLTWKYEGALLTRDEPGKARPGPDFSGLSWDGGDGDHILCVDRKGGYFYLFTNHYTWPKTGSGAAAFLRHRVARCAISDKMAPGKWRKFYNGKWSEPGFGGKASYVNGYCVTYNIYLKKYISFNCISGLSVCSDLEKQDWSPSVHVGPYWCINDQFGTWATDEGKTDIHTGDKTLYVYTFWRKSAGRRFRVEFGEGQTPASMGLAPPSLHLITPTRAHWAVTADPSNCYGYAPLFESADPIESRRTRRVPAASKEMSYAGAWADERNPAYYEGLARVSAKANDSAQFAFQGADIYWRLAKGPDCGMADVYLDGKLQATVDCWANLPSMYQFGFIKTGLAADAEHTIKVVVRGDRSSLSEGTAIKHMMFEYSAESYRASDGFSSVAGKNQWHYQQRNGNTFTDLAFKDPSWCGAGKCQIDYYKMVPDDNDAVRKWVAPHGGRVRIEGTLSLENKNGEGLTAAILHNAKEIWPAQTVKADKPLSHDTSADVAAGEALYFIVSKGQAAVGGQTRWNPVVTYVRSEAKAHSSATRPADYVAALKRAAAEELKAITAGTKPYLAPETWKSVAYAAEAPARDVVLNGGVLRECLDRNIAYLNRCFAKPHYNDEGENPWVKWLPASSEGRLLAGAAHTLRWGERPDMRKIVDTIVAAVKGRQAADGYCLPYDVSFMKPQKGAWQDERRNYDRVGMTRGLVAAGMAGNPDAYAILRKFYDWLNASPYYSTLLAGEFYGSAHNCNNGHAGGLLMYFSPVGKKDDLVAVERYFVQDFFIDQARNAEPLALCHYPLHTPHCYVLLAFEAWLDHYRATGAAKYLEAAKGAWRIIHESYEHVGGTIAICEEGPGTYPPKSYLLGKHTGETCGSVFWADFNHRFLQHYPAEEKYANEIEKVICNVLLAAQDKNGSIRYHNHLHGNKEGPQCANTCCEVMGIPFIARLPQYVYSIADDGLYVNLFASSSITWVRGGQKITLSSTTDFPYSGKVSLKLTAGAPVKMKLRIRVPSWAGANVTIHVNGAPAATGVPGTYAVLDRSWANNDVVTFELPMTFRLIRYTGRDRDPHHERYALEYGPILMALLGGTDLEIPSGQLANRLSPIIGSPLHFAIEGHPTCKYVPYWQVQGEKFTCFPTLR